MPWLMSILSRAAALLAVMVVWTAQPATPQRRYGVALVMPEVACQGAPLPRSLVNKTGSHLLEMSTPSALEFTPWRTGAKQCDLSSRS